MYDTNRLIRAKISLILKQPFFATLMMNKPFIENPAIKTARTNGKAIEYSPDFFDTLSHEETQGVICHELLHITSFHHTRRQGREKDRWNKACDFAINPILLECGLRLPDGALVSREYSNMSAEQIYTKLPAEDSQDDKSGDEEGESMGEVDDAPVATEEELKQAEAEARQQLVQAVNVAKKAKKMSEGLDRITKHLLKPKVHWKEVMPRFVSEIARNDYSFSKPNMRYVHTGFILPSLYSEEIGQIVLIVDTSGSVDEKALNEVATEAQEICNVFNARLKIIFVDDKVRHVQDVEPDEVLTLEAKGGNGTDFVPGFKWMEENEVEPKAVIYFTDLCCDSYPEAPDFPVLFVKHGGYQHYANPPFGEVVEMN